MQQHKVIKIFLLVSCICILFVTDCFASLENLDEMEARKVRKTANFFYSGESEANEFLWQPMTLCYADVNSGHEVWVMTNTDNATAYSGSEYGHQPWSADGKWFALAIDKNTRAFNRGSYYADEVWFTVKSDGSSLRPRINAPARVRTHSSYTQWSPVEPDTYFEFGRHYAGETGLDYNMLYKVTVSDNGLSMVPWIDYIPGNTSSERDLPKDAITSDGKYILATKFTESGIVAIGDLEARALKLPEYNMARGLDDYWYDTGSVADEADWHDEMFVGAGGNYWIYFLYTSGSWWRMRPWGSASDGGPIHVADHSSPQHDWTWWVGTDAQKELQPVNGKTGNRAFNSRYFSHGVAGRWPAYFAYSDVDNPSGVGPGVWNVDTDVGIGYGGAIGAQYSSWNGFTDCTTGSIGNESIYYMKYNTQNRASEVAYTHVTGSGGQFVKPGQSPDGTKTAFRSGFLQPTDTNGDVFYVVTEYPYPPEITQATTSNGVVTVRFDWRLETATPRGYTSRGWPNESTDIPPAPRETKEFRLWRSPNGATGWVPVKTIAASPFDKFDYVNGGVKNDQVPYWEMTDMPGDGTWYYAVTSVEHSGLESHTLSNIFSATGVQTEAYPANPGGVSYFFTTSPPTPLNFNYVKQATPGQYLLTWTEPGNPLIRYYNIYYSTDGVPSPIQQHRIASIPVGYSRYLDWLADQSLTGYYSITSVDYQGNESSIAGGGGGVDDTESPTVPMGLSATSIESNLINLQWNASTDNIGISGYKIYRNDMEVGSSSSTSFIDAGLSASTVYIYKVVAYDSSGNYSPFSQSISVTTEPEQSSDTQDRVLVDYGENVKYFKGSTFPGSGWNQLGFDDLGWFSGPTGIGFGDDDDATVLSDMQGHYISVYLRKNFVLDVADNISSMTLIMDFDDGFIAYLNGHEIARENMAGIPSYDTPASGYNEAGTAKVYNVSQYIGLLQVGSNVLSIEVHNAEINSSDVSLIPRLEISTSTSPVVDVTPPVPPSGLSVGIH